MMTKEYTLLEDLICNLICDYDEEVYSFEDIVIEIAEVCRKFKQGNLVDRLNRKIED